MIRVDGNGGTSSLVKVRGLNKTYSRGGEKIQVLQGLNLDVDKGDFVAFMGQRLRQDHSAQSPRRSRCTLRGQHYRRRGRNHAHVGKQTHALARAPRRVYFSD